MSDFVLRINMDNDAFYAANVDNVSAKSALEVASILERVIDELRNLGALVDGDKQTLRDSNGNRVGNWGVY